MALHVAEINRHRFVCGLFWQPLSRRRELRKEAIGLGRQLKFNLMVLRIDRGTAMVGFANAEDGARAGIASLGAMVSKTIAVEGAYYDGRQQRAPNWLGAFKLPDGMWAYFAVRDGLFLPNGDWAGPKEKVLDRLQSDYLLGGWNAIIGEPELESEGFHNFYPRRIDDLFTRRNGRPRVPRWMVLEPVQRQLPRPVIIGAAAVGVALLIGVPLAYYFHERAVQKEQEEAALRAIRLRRPLAAQQPLAHPWVKAPRPEAFTQACLDAFTTVTAGGWALDQYVCTPGHAAYSWTRGSSTIALLLARVPRAQIDAAGDHAALTASIAQEPGGDETLGSDQVRTNLMSVFQSLGLKAKFQPVREVEPPRTGPIAQLNQLNPVAAPPRPDWQTWTLDVSLGGLSPSRVAALMDQPGVRVERLAYHAGEWSLQGEVYVR